MIRLALRVRRADAELVLAELLSLVPAGVEERDDGDVVEYAVYGALGELPALPDLRAAAGAALVDVVTSVVADDWADRWRAFHRPVTVGRTLHVRPPWAPPAPAGLHDIVIDPGQAFGTGVHATTRLCLELLLELAGERGGGGAGVGGGAVGRGAGGAGAGGCGAVLDLGCGSGVLAIAAARLGFAPVRALDHDPLAVEATRANAAANGVEVEVVRHDLVHDGPPPAAPVVLANLLGPLLRRLAADGFARGAVPEALIAGGLLAAEADEIAAGFGRRGGLAERARRAEGEWAALVLAPPDPRRRGSAGASR